MYDVKRITPFVALSPIQRWNILCLCESSMIFAKSKFDIFKINIKDVFVSKFKITIQELLYTFKH